MSTNGFIVALPRAETERFDPPREPVNNIGCENRRMAELPELRNFANGAGGLTMMLLDRQRSSSSEGVFVVDGSVASTPTDQPAVEAVDAFKDGGRGRNPRPVDIRAARWSSLSPDDRRLFNRWTRAVVTFYSVIVIALLTAMWLGIDWAGGRSSLPASPVIERSSAGLPAPGAGSIGK